MVATKNEQPNDEDSLSFSAPTQTALSELSIFLLGYDEV